MPHPGLYQSSKEVEHANPQGYKPSGFSTYPALGGSLPVKVQPEAQPDTGATQAEHDLGSTTVLPDGAAFEPYALYEGKGSRTLQAVASDVATTLGANRGEVSG